MAETPITPIRLPLTEKLAAQAVLRDGETLSGLLRDLLRREVLRREVLRRSKLDRRPSSPHN